MPGELYPLLWQYGQACDARIRSVDSRVDIFPLQPLDSCTFRLFGVLSRLRPAGMRHIQSRLVGAIGFEPTTPCAQGRCEESASPTERLQAIHCRSRQIEKCGPECGLSSTPARKHDECNRDFATISVFLASAQSSAYPAPEVNLPIVTEPEPAGARPADQT